MDSLSSTVGIVALAACAVALIALVLSIVLAVRLRRLRATQRVVLGDAERDLVAHSAELTSGFEALHAYVEDIAQRLIGRLDTAEQRLDGAVAYRGLVRYDAYNELSGRQSIVDRAARRVEVGDRAELDRPPRPGADLRQARRRRQG